MEFHPFFVHFPISLFLIAFLLEISHNKIDWLHANVPLLIFVFASILSIPTAFTGNSAKIDVGKIYGIFFLLESHDSAGTIVTISGILFSFLLIFFKLKFPTKSLSIMKKSIFILMSIMVLYTGYLGGKMVHEFGAGTKIILELNN